MPSKSVSDVAVSGSTLIAAQRPTGSIISRVTDPIVMIRPAQSSSSKGVSVSSTRFKRNRRLSGGVEVSAPKSVREALPPSEIQGAGVSV